MRTQNSFCTQQVRDVRITRIVILFGLNLCAETPDRFLEAVLFGVGVYLQMLTVGSFVGAQLG